MHPPNHTRNTNPTSTLLPIPRYYAPYLASSRSQGSQSGQATQSGSVPGGTFLGSSRSRSFCTPCCFFGFVLCLGGGIWGVIGDRGAMLLVFRRVITYLLLLRRCCRRRAPAPPRRRGLDGGLEGGGAAGAGGVAEHAGVEHGGGEVDGACVVLVFG